MKAVVMTGNGQPGVLALQDKEMPTPSDEQIVVKIHATTINPLDCKVRQGDLKAFFKNVTVLGFDFAGVIESVGAKVTDYKKDDKVFGIVGREAGCHAEYVICSTENLAPMPKNCSFESAAAMATGGLTALQALRDKAKIRAEDNVLIIGASGGVGSMAVQLAKRVFNTKVTAIASSKHRAMLPELGADTTIAYDTEQLPTEKFDIIFDASGKYSPTQFHYKRMFVSTLPSVKRFLLKFIFKSNKMVFVQPSHKDLLFLKEQIEKGNLSAHINQRFSLDETAQAHKAFEKGSVNGKIVINVIPEARKTPATKKVTSKKALTTKAKAVKKAPAKKKKKKAAPKKAKKVVKKKKRSANPKP